MLIVTLIQYTPITQDALFSIIQSVMPETMTETTMNIIQEVYSKSIGTVSISAIFVLWSAKGDFMHCRKDCIIYMKQIKKQIILLCK